VWINRDDVVLLGLRDYQDEKADIIHKFGPEEVQKLKKLGEIPAKAAIADADLLDDDDDLVDFATNLDDI
jgi:translation initiation factor 1A